MCIFGRQSEPQGAAPRMLASTDNREAREQGRLETALRRRRAGAAANILTSPVGIPSMGAAATMGGTA